ncbi:hypothetical protein IEQ34_021939 [Dendrobium chrysotoxum]|uniref:Uncharacterized protein n=1 Tax=Dendrobium chrysotoxum TaxID=161865 RepID=A0AAV7FJY7_DENCH|nr:hypothetical protein IEQ34_021939 [Dendrobium chrysotoxum]
MFVIIKTRFATRYTYVVCIRGYTHICDDFKYFKGRIYANFDPFIIASQASQVFFVMNLDEIHIILDDQFILKLSNMRNQIIHADICDFVLIVQDDLPIVLDDLCRLDHTQEDPCSLPASEGSKRSPGSLPTSGGSEKSPGSLPHQVSGKEFYTGFSTLLWEQKESNLVLVQYPEERLRGVDIGQVDQTTIKFGVFFLIIFCIYFSVDDRMASGDEGHIGFIKNIFGRNKNMTSSPESSCDVENIFLRGKAFFFLLQVFGRLLVDYSPKN